MSNIIVEVLGGVVQNVYCDDPEKTQVVVVDWDDGAEMKAGAFPTRTLMEASDFTSSAFADSTSRGQ